MVTSAAVDEFPRDVGVPRVPGGVLEDVDQHPAQRDRIAEPRRARRRQVELRDDLFGRGPGPGKEGQESPVSPGAARMSASMSSSKSNGKASWDRPNVSQNQPY